MLLLKKKPTDTLSISKIWKKLELIMQKKEKHILKEKTSLPILLNKNLRTSISEVSHRKVKQVQFTNLKHILVISIGYQEAKSKESKIKANAEVVGLFLQ